MRVSFVIFFSKFTIFSVWSYLCDYLGTKGSRLQGTMGSSITKIRLLYYALCYYYPNFHEINCGSSRFIKLSMDLKSTVMGKAQWNCYIYGKFIGVLVMGGVGALAHILLDQLQSDMFGSLLYI